MAQRAPDKLGENDDHNIIELGDEDFDIDPKDISGKNDEHSVVRAAPEKTNPQAGAKYCDFKHINPSMEGWSVRLDLGSANDEEVRADTKTLDTWRKIGVFNIKFEKFGKKLIAKISHSEDFEEQKFGPKHMALLGKKRYHVIATAPPSCLIKQKPELTIKKERIAIQAKTRATLNEEIGKKAAILEQLAFKRFAVYIAAARLDHVLPKLRTVADLEGLSYQQLDFGPRIRKIIFSKGPNAAKQMIERKHALYFASFNPDIE